MAITSMVLVSGYRPSGWPALARSPCGLAGTVGFPWPDATFTVEWTIGSLNVLAVFTVDTMFLRSSAGSMDRTVANCAGR